ncbi:DUF7660 family protein [Pararhizobium sp. O133]|uniref:DUF7660 family protein n=1 Tax=Pararhizobium sp. O133 TaxID=3449278 RepID=UPI003F686929
MNHGVHDRETFLQYLAQLSAELGAQQTDDWENDDLQRFLKAMQAWASDRDGTFSANPWQHAADLLYAARRYE